MRKMLLRLKETIKRRLEFEPIFLPLLLFTLFLSFLSFWYLRMGQDFNFNFEHNDKEYILKADGKDISLKVKDSRYKSIKADYNWLIKYDNKVRADLGKLKDENEKLKEEKGELEARNDKLDSELSKMRSPDFEGPEINDREVYIEDLNGDGIDEIIIKSYIETKIRFSRWDHWIDVVVFSRRSEKDNYREVHRERFPSFIEKPRIIDLNNDGKNEMVLSWYQGSGCYGYLLIVYEEDGVFKSVDTQKLNAHPLKVYTNKENGKVYLVSNLVFWSNEINKFDYVILPALYEWTGSRFTPVSQSELNSYYNKEVIPEIKESITILKKRVKENDEYRKSWEKRLKFVNAAYKAAREIMAGKIDEMGVYSGSYEWKGEKEEEAMELQP